MSRIFRVFRSRDLRVGTQVFTVVNDSSAMDFSELDYAGSAVDGRHQAKSLAINPALLSDIK